MYNDLRTILSLCSAITTLFCLIYVWNVIYTLWGWLRHKKPIGDSLNPVKSLEKSLEKMYRDGSKKGTALLVVIFLIGIGNWAAEKVFTTREIGAFYEESGEFEENYEAYIYIEDKPVFCIVEINKWIDVYEGCNGRTAHDVSYYISSIHLPYGKTEYDIDDYYEPDAERNSVSIGLEWPERCKIEIGPVATERSYKLLDAEIVSAYGEFCASRNEDTYHLLSCPSVKSIKAENKIFFENRTEAEVLQYAFCDRCADRW